IDDVVFRHFIASVVHDHGPPYDNFTYRFTWWLPTAAVCRLLGLNEVAIVLPITVASVFGIGLVYVLGWRLFGRVGAVAAALLLVVHPLDFAWSTMVANDIYFSVFAGLTILAVLLALEPVDPARKRRRWLFAAFALVLSYHAKASAPALVVVVAI